MNFNEAAKIAMRDTVQRVIFKETKEAADYAMELEVVIKDAAYWNTRWETRGATRWLTQWATYMATYDATREVQDEL